MIKGIKLSRAYTLQYCCHKKKSPIYLIKVQQFEVFSHLSIRFFFFNLELLGISKCMYLFDTFYIVERYKNWIVSFEICPHILKTKNQKPNIKNFVRFYLTKKKVNACLDKFVYAYFLLLEIQINLLWSESTRIEVILTCGAPTVSFH